MQTQTSQTRESLQADGPIVKWKDPYIWVSGGVMAWAVLLISHRRWGGDFDLHMATVWALIADPASPKDPLVGSSTPSAYFTPYTVVLGLLARAFGVFPLHIFEIAALVNVALLLWGFRRFCRHFGGPGSWTAVAALAAIVLISGVQTPAWSGFLDLGSLSGTLTYPSLFASALMFFAWDHFLLYRKDPSPKYLLCLAILGAAIVLVHPFTGFNTALGICAFLVAVSGKLRPRTLAHLAGGLIVTVLLVAIWPYYHPRLLLTSSSGEYDLAAVHYPLVEMFVGRWGIGAYTLAFVGLPALYWRRKRPLGAEMIWLLVLASSLVALAVAIGEYALLRSIPVALLALQLSLAAYLAEALASKPSRRTWAYLGLVFATSIAGLYGGRSAVARAWPPDFEASASTGWWRESRQHSILGVERYLSPGDVVIVDTDDIGRGLNSLGVFTVEHHMMYPFLPDDEARRRDATTQFFSRETSPTERRTIADEFGVRCFLAVNSPWLHARGSVSGFTRLAIVGSEGVPLVCRPDAK